MASSLAPAVSVLEASVRRSASFRAWLRSRRWCGEAVGLRSELAVQDFALLSETGMEALVFLLVLSKEESSPVLLHLPLSVARARFDPDAFELDAGPDRYYVLEAERREPYARLLVDGFRGGTKIHTRASNAFYFQGEPWGAFRSLEPPASNDSSNVLLRIALSERTAVVKSYKLLDPHNREPAILERLHRRRFPHAPRLLGEISLGRGEDRLVLGAATEWIDAVDLFTWLVSGWQEALVDGNRERTAFEECTGVLAADLGTATAILHEALVDRKPGPFQAEPFTADDVQAAYRLATRNLSDSLRLLARGDLRDLRVTTELAAKSRTLLLDHRREIEDTLAFLTAGVGTVKSVTHADLHLGQVLRARRDAALTFIDFEGEPERVPAQRSVKLPPLRDVATMIRSFAYVRHAVWHGLARGRDGGKVPPVLQGDDVPSESRDLFQRLRLWEDFMAERFRERYLARTSLYPELDSETADRLIRGWVMEKALYELRYELKHRPALFTVPLDGIHSLTQARG